MGGEEEVGGNLGCLVWRVKDRVAGSRLRGWGVSHEGGCEWRGYYLRRGRLVLEGTIKEGVEGMGGQFVCICEHVSLSRPFA